jgi:hypothetical protein
MAIIGTRVVRGEAYPSAMNTTEDPPPPVRPDRRALRILARSLARDLAADGIGTAQLIVLASELLDEATLRLRTARGERDF